MSGRVVGVVSLVLATLVTPSAHARPACPTITDAAGDTGNQIDIADDASDLTAVAVSSSRTAVTVQLTVVGQPAPEEAAGSRVYEAYLETGEGGYAVQATLGMGTAVYRLMVSRARASEAGGSAFSYSNVKEIAGRVGPHAVTMTVPLDKELPLRGRRVEVLARTWRMAGGSATVAGHQTPNYGFTASLDDTDRATFRIGDPGCRPRG